ncbi:GDSL-type esterase/lipase family protein [Alicyclobacillus dauci]|uniref:GDSL-type esterase/lipase family protein n=1 Tax=Alicyclobacillus dauci TaxID=1475485 RepID=A0ABY6Z1V9_9BACL|nr:GDSL-type esterase/lipase family protein [Alicyclobacillus dauci]WAH36874.1 GDSL-type esterase/lipase family protein [Alicyclobacillus dauci]
MKRGKWRMILFGSAALLLCASAAGLATLSRQRVGMHQPSSPTVHESPSVTVGGSSGSNRSSESKANSTSKVRGQPHGSLTPKLHGTIVSLGDSITYGFNLPGAHGEVPSPDAYPFLLGSMLHKHVMDLGVPHWTTSALIQALDTPPFQSALRQASVVTVDIGSNDILHAFNGVLADYLQGIEPSSMQPTIDALNENIQSLQGEYATVIEKIRAQTSAPIVLTTLYDPAPDSTPMHDFADPYIVRANNVIMGAAATYHTLLYDAYGTVNHNQWSLIRLEDIDIHPTIPGQKALAAGFYEVWQNKSLNEPTRYAVTEHVADIYAKRDVHSDVIGRIKGVNGYPVLSQTSSWDEIRVQETNGFVRRRDVTEIVRREPDARFGLTTVEATPVQCRVDGTEDSLQGLLVNGRLYAPAAALGHLAGRDVRWNNSTRTVEIAAGDPAQIDTTHQPNVAPPPTTSTPELVTVEYMGAAVTIGGEMVDMPVEPFSYQGDIYAPVAPVWTQLGGQMGALDGQFH